MRLDDYLSRINYDGSADVSAATLRALHRAHVHNIPYENLSIQCGEIITRSPVDAYDKIVGDGRGGWCFEMNGLFAWALEEIGFQVRRLAGGVHREARGDETVGNHLVLAIDLDRPYLADVGFSDGLIEPVPLEVHSFRNGPYSCRLERVDGGWWRYVNGCTWRCAQFRFSPRLSR